MTLIHQILSASPHRDPDRFPSRLRLHDEPHQAAERLADVLADLKDRAETEVAAELSASAQEGAELSEDEENALVSSRYREYRRDFLFTLMEFFAKRMRERPGHVAFRNVEAVEDLARSLDRNMNELAVLAFFMDRARFEGGSR